jgi:hypothetical protein
VSTEQEYDAPNDMIDDVEPDTPGPGPYPNQFPGNQQQQQQSHNMSMPPSTTGSSVQPHMAEEQDTAQTSGQGYPSMTQLLDPALDWDPFGLSASMAFPTQFSFDTSSMR